MANKKTPKAQSRSAKKTTVPQSVTSSFVSQTGLKKVSPKMIVMGGGIAVLALLLVLLSRYLVVATVNGSPITRMEYYQELETMSGKQVMDNLITRKLVEQKLSENKITIDQKTVDGEIKKLETQLSSQGQKLEDLLTMQGIDRRYLEKNIRLQKGVEQLLSSKNTVTEKEIDEYIAKNQEQLAQGGVSETDQRNQVRELLKSQKFSKVVQDWLEKIKKEAKIKNY
ncbi:hypothetical protein COU89_02280 [Candidatus Roizmanbacteria bacterium CG10_big_fil_rev_8_21_14_0_10_45_7]|uniref:SurA N-terminal domain-containing protein n=1 Tax=Candidatus Roizmanbacteria bacterium CG10_big_fil_rev_8_21_14_0_10_45_7 TaxID=1974854 RepID=A0A2M8KUM5_9BACT|nr:MAG: hypothetical protein COU89_02280 [Candidatus Roizmanbacteria bacterium CG10_big_fil_rev_8_21_14_0_10_45_7]